MWAAPELVRYFCHAILFGLGLVAFLGVLIWFVWHPVHHRPAEPTTEEAAVLQDLLPESSR